MLDDLFQFSLHDIADVLLGFLPQAADQFTYIRWFKPILGTFFIIIEVLIIFLNIFWRLIIGVCFLCNCLALLDIECIIQIINFYLLSGTIFEFWTNSLLGKELKIDLDRQNGQVRILGFIFYLKEYILVNGDFVHEWVRASLGSLELSFISNAWCLELRVVQFIHDHWIFDKPELAI